MTSPAKRLRPTAPPSPIALTITPTAPAAGPTAADITPETVQTEWPTFTVPADTEFAAVAACPNAWTHGNPFRYCSCGWTEPATESDLPALEALDLTPGEAAIITAIEAWSATITDRLNVLTDAVNLVGQQQQWTTDTITELRGQFEGMLAGGNPLKMISAMMGGRK